MTVVLASSDRVQLCYMPESNFGVVPVTGNPSNLRMTGETLDFNLTKESDKEITASAQLNSTTTINGQAAGDVKVHMQYGEYDRLLAAVMRTAWAVYGVNGVGATATCDFAATTITAAVAPTGASAYTTLAKGQWFRLLAPSHANNGKLFRVSTVTAPTSTVITVDASTVLTTGSAVASTAVQTSRLVNGTTLTPFTIERQVNDVTQFFTFRGMYPSKFATAFAAAKLTEGTFTFLGKDMIRNVTTQLPGTAVASLAHDIQNAVSGVGNIWEAGVPLASTFIKSMTLDIDSALRAQDAIGTLGLVGVGIGTFMAKGSLEVYFADGNLFDKFLNDTFTSISLSTKDPSGNGYVFTFPRVQLTGAKISAGSKNADLMASFQYQAYADNANATAALRYTMFIDRFGVAVLP